MIRCCIFTLLLLGPLSAFHGGARTAEAAGEAVSPPRGTPAARLLPGEFSSEYWELTARFDSGHLLFANFLITNIGWGDRNAVAIIHIVAPDGQTYQYDNARREGNWRLSPDRLRLEIGPNSLDLHEPLSRLQTQKKSVRLNLQFRLDSPAVWSETLTRSGYMLDLLAAAIPVEGSLWIKGMPNDIAVRGLLAATHMWLNNNPATLLTHRLEFFTLQKDFPVYCVDFTAPSGEHARWLVVRQQGKILFESDRFDLTPTKYLDEHKDPGYSVPSEFHLKSASIIGQARLEREALRNDPFANLPGPLRFLVSTALNFHPRRVWRVSPFAVTLQPRQLSLSVSVDLPLTRQATGVTAITFLNPMNGP